MKGLMLKDFYMIRKYCRAHMIIILSFTLVSVIEKDNAFFMIYPIIMASMIPVTLLSYDERQKWSVYSMTLPYTRRQMVSVKYWMTFLIVVCIWGLSAAIQMLHTMADASFREMLLFELPVMLFIGLTAPAVMLPLVFKYGTEKGRAMYYAVVIVFAAFYGSIVVIGPEKVIGALTAGWFSYALMAAGLILFALSWQLSAFFYEKREL